MAKVQEVITEVCSFWGRKQSYSSPLKCIPSIMDTLVCGKSDFRVPGPSLVGWTDTASAHPNCVFAQGKLHVTILLLTGKKMRNLQ